MFFITPPGFRTAVDAPGEPILPIHGVILPQSSQNYQMHTLHKWHTLYNSFPPGDTTKSFLTFRRYNVSWALQISRDVVKYAGFLCNYAAILSVK
jgi:hypothetical protein